MREALQGNVVSMETKRLGAVVAIYSPSGEEEHSENLCVWGRAVCGEKK